MKKKTIFMTIILVCLVAFFCGKKHEPGEHDHDHGTITQESHDHEHTGTEADQGHEHATTEAEHGHDHGETGDHEHATADAEHDHAGETTGEHEHEAGSTEHDHDHGETTPAEEHDHDHGETTPAEEHDHEHTGTEADHSHEQVTTEADHSHEQVTTEAEHDHDHGTETTSAAESHDHLHISPGILKNWGIEYGSPVRRKFMETRILPGVITENKEKSYLVNALVPGVVTAMKRDIGDTVKKGTVLCVLNSPQLLELKTRYIKAYQEFLLDMQNYGRAKNLYAEKAIERKELTGRETRYKTSLAEWLSLEAELKSLGFSDKLLKSVTGDLVHGKTASLKKFLSPFYYIPSPGPGKVVARDISLGEQLDNNKTIFEVSDTRKLWVLLDAREPDLQYLEQGKNAEIYSDLFPGKIYLGKITRIFEKLHPKLRTLKVRAEVDNSAGILKPGMYVRGRVNKGVGADKLAIPAAALVKLFGVDGIFLKETDGFAFKPVQVIAADSAGFVFVNGLTAGSTIVVKGAFYLKAEQEISKGNVDPHAGHQH